MKDFDTANELTKFRKPETKENELGINMINTDSEKRRNSNAKDMIKLFENREPGQSKIKNALGPKFEQKN